MEGTVQSLLAHAANAQVPRVVRGDQEWHNAESTRRAPMDFCAVRCAVLVSKPARTRARAANGNRLGWRYVHRPAVATEPRARLTG
eukprot:3818802-Prymnesium_polylepis.2